MTELMERPRSKYWVTAEKIRVKISSMSNSHLINTIKMLNRVSNIVYNNNLDAAMSYPGHGDMATYEAEHIFYKSNKDYLPPIYIDLQEEATGRGLEI